MYEIKIKEKDKLREHIPEWVRILQDYFRQGEKQYLSNKAKYQN